MDKKLCDPAMCTCNSESQPCPGLYKKNHDQQVEKLIHSSEIPCGVLCLYLESSVQERHGPVGVDTE